MATLAELITTSNWQQLASCRGHDPDLWWVEDPHDLGRKIALDICAECPVRQECLEHAMQTPERDGIWGGMLPYQRKRLAVYRREGRVA